MVFASSLYDKILLETENEEYLEFMDDNTNYIKLTINLSSREQIEIVKRKRR